MTTFLIVAFAVGVAVIIEVCKKLNALETRTTKLVAELSELFRLVDEQVQRLPSFESSGAILTRCPSKKVAERLARHPPSLRALFGFGIWMTSEYAQSVIGLTQSEIDQLRKVVPLAEHYSMLSMLCEIYDTHIVYFKGDEVIRRAYDALDQRINGITVLWEYQFQRNDVLFAEKLELVVYRRNVSLWALRGRFGSEFEGNALDKNVFISIPLTTTNLAPYLRPDETHDDSGIPPYKSSAWYQQYTFSDERGCGWDCTLTDVECYSDVHRKGV